MHLFFSPHCGLSLQTPTSALEEHRKGSAELSNAVVFNGPRLPCVLIQGLSYFERRKQLKLEPSWLGKQKRLSVIKRPFGCHSQSTDNDTFIGYCNVHGSTFNSPPHNYSIINTLFDILQFCGLHLLFQLWINFISIVWIKPSICKFKTS